MVSQLITEFIDVPPIKSFRTSKPHKFMPAGLPNGMTHSMEPQHLDVVK